MRDNEKTTKTRFECSEIVYDVLDCRKDIEAYFKKNLKKHGFVYDKQMDQVYKDFDRAIFLNEGDCVDLIPFCSYQKVSFKYYLIDEDMMIYHLEQI